MSDTGHISNRIVVLALALGACNGVAARVRSVAPARVTEGQPTTVTLETEGCAPRIDIDRGVRTGDVATVRLEGVDPLAAARIGLETFEMQLPGSIAPGNYALDLRLDDGRIAHADTPLEVAPLDPVVTAVDSDRTALSFGDTAIPFAVTIRNESSCAVDDLQVTPTFRQTTTAFSLAYRGPAAVSIAARASIRLPYEVDLDATVMAGTLSVNAMATGGTRSNTAGCTGTVEASNTANDLLWVIVPVERQTLSVTGLSYSPGQPHSGGMINVSVAVRNDTGTDITVEQVQVQSYPAGVSGTAAFSRGLAPGAVAPNLSVNIVAPEVSGDTHYRVWASVAGRDASGTLYNSQPRAAAVDMTVYAH